MKFAKHCERVCAELSRSTKVPAFPYKELKKRLKNTRSADPRTEFCVFLTSRVQEVDVQWKKAVRSALRAERTTWSSGMLGLLGLRNKADVMERQRCLAEWGGVARTGLRKIKKKYNKLLAATHGPLDNFPGVSQFAFLQSRERTEIEALAAQESQEAGSLDCPVCLETLVEPVAPPCGHPVCSRCFDDLWTKREGVRTVSVAGGTLVVQPKGSCPQCPVCRAPARDLRSMPTLARMAASPPRAARVSI